jgi:hypothetical protein
LLALLGAPIVFAVRRGYAAIAHYGRHRAPSWDTAWARDPDALMTASDQLLVLILRM